MFGNVRKSAALFSLKCWDKVETHKPLSTEEKAARNEGREEFKKLFLLEEVFWRQKSRELLLEVDWNTTFFYKMFNVHGRKNTLLKVKIDGPWLNES